MSINKSNILTSFIHSSQEIYDFILFEIAVYWAEQGEYVLFISPKKITSLPTGWNKIPEKEVLKFITFLYLSTPKEFSEKLHDLHTWHRAPRVILVSGLDLIVKTNPDNMRQHLAFLCALLIDCIQFCSQKFENIKSYLFVSISKALTKEQFETIFNLCLNYNFYDVTMSNFDEMKTKIMLPFVN